MDRTTKECRHCHEIKPTEAFRVNVRNGNPTLASYCRHCETKKAVENRRKRHPPKPKGPPSEETRRKISEARKKWCRENPDKLPWLVRAKTTFKSKPCEHVKDYLRGKGIIFAEEYMPRVEGRFFSLDIAFPDKKIAIEINGNQHYNPDGTLRPYYQERHDILERNGWLIYEIYFAMCYQLEKFETMLTTILASDKKCEFDYGSYHAIPRSASGRPKKNVYKLCECGGRMCNKAIRCKKCYGTLEAERAKSSAKDFVITKAGETWTREVLSAKVKEIPMTKIAKAAGVSDVAVKKWCKRLGIEIPNMRGYWSKKAKKIRTCKCGGIIEDIKKRRCPKCTKPIVRPIVSPEALSDAIEGSRSLAATARKLGVSKRWAATFVKEYRVKQNGLAPHSGFSPESQSS